ncbi:phosphoinositide 3-kinase regulatory subunit 4 isoform X2 [Planococcus citri]|uniref:phosphoinositide 3-kinase regulatory subunit 4 isoform X2 n=1 Tax=Planococcus citri TaxID=170843 RepID=UPI0031F96F5C
MGNQLVGVAPSQIFPVEHYLTHHPNLRFDGNLGSTRFFKVARAESSEGLIVVKVFVMHDLSLLLNKYQQEVEEIKNKLSSSLNCLPFRKAIVSHGAAFLMREYVKYNLYDRISTRPFLALIEKKWIAFQILLALHHCHKVGVCHGDVKLENIMVTSWHWVMLTDFASFKPTYLPDDNPADFSFFFDTSRRRTCYIAPERFVSNPDSNTLPLQDVEKNELTPAMDIFSAGCVLAELFSDGRQLFDLSQLLSYRNNEFEQVPHILKTIEDPAVQQLISDMIQRNPSKRLSAESYLDRERGRLFPEYFYDFLQLYMSLFSTSSPTILSPDEKIERLYQDNANVIKLLEDSEAKEKKKNLGEDYEEGECEALVLITTLVTSFVRGLKTSSSKLKALEILFTLSKHTSVETILDRIIPYILDLLQDGCTRVCISAIHTINNCLNLIQSVPPSDANIFPEYILPALTPISQHKEVAVRTALAEVIAQISETSMKFLEYTQTVTLENHEIPCHTFESEVATLHEMIRQCVSSLFTDSQNIVKRTLIENGIVRLCTFFGKIKSNEIVLSHMVTFLNDKNDKQLRASFFDCIPGVAGYIGIFCTDMLIPLLLQGTTDSEEYIIRKAINSMSAMTELGLFKKSTLLTLINGTACLMIHPNLWIRRAVVGFIKRITRILSPLEVECHVSPIIIKFMKHAIHQLDTEKYVLNALQPPIPRFIHDNVYKSNDLELFLNTLEARRGARQMGARTEEIFSSSLIRHSTTFQALFRRLCSEGMDDTVEDKILLMADHYKKLNQYYINVEKPSAPTGKVKIDVSHLQHGIKFHTVHFSKSDILSKDTRSNVSHRKRFDDGGSHLVGGMNEEWKHMFGINNSSSKQGIHSSDTLHESISSKKSSTFSVDQSLEAESIQEHSYVQYRYPPCKTDLNKIIRTKQEQYESAVVAQDYLENAILSPSLPPPGWEFRSSLIAHLHEHKSAVNKLVTIPGSNLFASCSDDQCVKLWDCSKIEGRNIANKSKLTYNTKSGGLNSMTICRNNQSLAVCSNSGNVSVLNIDSGGKMSTLHSRKLDLKKDGCAVDIAYFDPGHQSVVVYVTMYGTIVGWDLRAYEDAWRIDSKSKQGVITTMCMDSFQNCLILGTGCGYHTCIDLRFRLPITSVVHPYNARVRKVIRHPKESSWIISSVHGNNEISVWDMETGSRQLNFWANETPPLSKPTENGNSTCALYAYYSERSHILLSGGTDQRIRKWCLKPFIDECNVVIPSANDYPQTTYNYSDRLVDGTRVIEEHCQLSVQKEKSMDNERQGVTMNDTSQLAAGPELPSSGHRDTITDITMCQTPTQCFLVTSARDGVIKVWK